MDPQTIQNYWRKSGIMLPNWSAYFASEDQWAKSRLTKEYEDLALLRSKLQLGQDEMPFVDFLIMEGEDIIQVEYCILELVDVALRQRQEPPSLDLTVEPLDFLNVDERPPLRVKLANAQHHVQLLATFLMGHPLEFTPIDVKKLHVIIGGAQYDACWIFEVPISMDYWLLQVTWIPWEKFAFL